MKNDIMKKNNGITLITLVITIIILTIIGSITVYEGVQSIEEAKVQKCITNMLSIKSKVNGYSEEIDSKTWDKKEADSRKSAKVPLFEQNKLTVAASVDKNIFANKRPESSNFVFYNVTVEALKNMKLEDLIEDEGSNYIVVFSVSDDGTYGESDVIYTKGVKYKKQMYYTLSELQVVMDGE